MIQTWSQLLIQSLSYGCFSTGMHDDHMITLIDWQEAPLGYSVACNVLATAVNNHEILTWNSLKPGQSHSSSRPSQALLIDKWEWPSIEIVEMQLATSAGAGRPRYTV